MRLARLTAVLALSMLAQGAHADLFYDVTIDTSNLTTAMDPAIAVQFIDGSGLDDNNNLVTLSNFSFGGGSASSCAVPNNCELVNGASGELAAGVTLHDSSFFNAFFQRFTPGNTLSFLLSFTTNADLGGTPDSFGLNLLLGPDVIPTLDDLGTDTFLRFDLSDSPVLNVFGSAPGVVAIAAPRVAASVPGAVPLPGTLALVGAGLAALCAAWVRRRRAD